MLQGQLGALEILEHQDLQVELEQLGLLVIQVLLEQQVQEEMQVIQGQQVQLA